MVKNNNSFKLLITIVLVVVVLPLLGIVLHLYSTALNVANTPATLVDRAMTPQNIENSYHLFRDEKLNYDSRLAQINAKAAELNDTSKNTNEYYLVRTELDGQKQSCRDIASDYNSNSLKADKNLFKDPIFIGNHMPQTLDLNACESGK